eukprot:scaffold3277_cov218-Pinguiococcus_pyrenoidosus.AAC.7
MSAAHRSSDASSLHRERLEALEALCRRHQDRMLPGGELPAAAQKYFTPHGIWARQPLDDPRGDVLFEALQDYFDLYLKHLPRETDAAGASGLQERLASQEEYCDYRRRNDPGARVLNKIFGEAWTEQLLSEALFPSPAR